MAKSEILLIEEVQGLGGEGDSLQVSAGYARNYLFPRRKAIPMTRANRKQIEALQKRKRERKVKEFEGAEAMAKAIEGKKLVFVVKTGSGGKMFGAVTADMLWNRLKEGEIELNKKVIALEAPVKTLGEHAARIKLHAKVMVDLKFEVVSENPVEEESK